MLSIGEFSKICGVSTKTLRYYDEIGLIKPDEIHSDNGYRYYAVGQLNKMLLINRLKSYQFSLEEIKAVLELEEDLAEEKLHSILNRKRSELQEKRNAIELSLNQLNIDIFNLEAGIPIMSYLDRIEVQLVETRSINIFSMRRMMSSDDFAAGYDPYFSRLYEKIAAEKLTLLGTPIAIYHSPEYDPTGNDTEFAIPVRETGEGTRELNGGPCAKAVLNGSYSELTSVYAKLRGWMDQEGYVLASSPYEIYLTAPDRAAAPGELVTEVYFPVAKKQRLNTNREGAGDRL
ncbi:MerR family transcriptional regulator [Paenibacillus oceani]|uniref:MerR family transcriptional regulator n=1 Tax=Paenibacillus oceani TaxID=2772510 RepID=A0A927CF20_9BACL|nr:MerR family transcriptional regulator [Paenibacillus oceani]MBD2864776.1 MerR family transcriptional regulator [Paenibacillus oceani]